VIITRTHRGKEQRGASATRGSRFTIHGRLGNLEKSGAFFEIGVSGFREFMRGAVGGGDVKSVCRA
jgi:hypothetical protein